MAADPIRRRFTSWTEGTFVLYLRAGHELTVRGRLRFEKTPDNYFGGYELDTDDLEMHPSFDEVVAIGRISG